MTDTQTRVTDTQTRVTDTQTRVTDTRRVSGSLDGRRLTWRIFPSW